MIVLLKMSIESSWICLIFLCCNEAAKERKCANIAVCLAFCHNGLRDLFFYLVAFVRAYVVCAENAGLICVSRMFCSLRASKWNGNTWSANQHEAEIKSRAKMWIFFIFRLRYVLLYTFFSSIRAQYWPLSLLFHSFRHGFVLPLLSHTEITLFVAQKAYELFLLRQLMRNFYLDWGGLCSFYLFDKQMERCLHDFTWLKMLHDTHFCNCGQYCLQTLSNIDYSVKYSNWFRNVVYFLETQSKQCLHEKDTKFWWEIIIGFNRITLKCSWP